MSDAVSRVTIDIFIGLRLQHAGFFFTIHFDKLRPRADKQIHLSSVL